MSPHRPSWIELVQRCLGRLARDLEQAPGPHWYVGEGTAGPWRWAYHVQVRPLDQTLEGKGPADGVAPVRRR